MWQPETFDADTIEARMRARIRATIRDDFAFRHHHRFRNFAFVGAPFFDDYDYAAYGNGCWQQEWTGYSWQWINVCNDYGY